MMLAAGVRFVLIASPQISSETASQLGRYQASGLVTPAETRVSRMDHEEVQRLSIPPGHPADQVFLKKGKVLIIAAMITRT